MAVKTAIKAGEKASAKTIETKGIRAAAKRQAKATKKLRKATERQNTTRAERLRKVAKKHRPAVTTKAGRKVIVRQKAHGINRAALTAAPTVGAVGAGVATSTGEALKEDPGKVLKTTARAIPGFVTAPVKIAAETYETGKNLVEGKDDPFAPLKAEGEAQLDYYEKLAEVAQGGEKAKRLIKNELGLVPAITAGLGVHAATRPFKAPKVSAAESKFVRDGVKPVRVKKLRARIADPDSDKAEDAARLLTEAEKGKGKKRREVAQRLDVAKRRGRAGYARDLENKVGKGHAQKMRNLYRSLRDTKVAGRVNMDDVAHLVIPEGIPLDRVKGRAALIEIRDSLKEPKREPSPRAKPTREVLDAIIERPELLELPELEAFWSAAREARKDVSVQRHEDRVGVEAAEGKPDPFDDRPRLLSLARQKDILAPEERPHPDLPDDGFKIPTPKKYRDHDKAVKKRAEAWKKRARKKENDAKVLQRHAPEKAAKLIAEATELRAAAEARLAVVTRPAKAAKLDAEARELRQAGDPDAARELLSRARDLRRQHQAGRSRRLDEFRSDVQSVIDSGERRDPVFFHETSAADGLKGPSGGGRFRAGAGLAAADKMRTGKLREMGLVDHRGRNMMEGLFRDRMNREMGAALRDIINRFAHPDLPLVTGDRARRMIESGEAPQGHGLIPVQEFKRAYARGKWEHALKLIDEGMQRKLENASKEKGRKYAWISNAAMQELYAQMQPVGRAGRNLKHFGALQSFALLGTSPTWVAFQSIATPMLLLARHPNPRTWARAVKHEAEVYKNLTPQERKAFDAEIGGNVGDVYGFQNVELGATPNNINAMQRAGKAAGQTLAGRTLRAIFSGGGPFIKGVAKYEGKLRHLEALMEMDKLHNPTRVRKFFGSMASLDHATREHIEKLSKLSPVEQARYYAKHPEDGHFLTEQVNNALGDWSSMTKLEKNASSVLIFYPFLRFSLKWMFQTFPKNNPVKAAILLNLAQQNAQEVETLLGGAPSFFQSYGLVPFRNGEGEITGGLNLGRVAPGSNALVEGLGGGEDLNISTVTRLLQPVLSAGLTQGIGGLDPFTGEKVAEGSKEHLTLLAKQIFGLNPASRAWLVPKIAPSSDISKVFQDRTPWEKSLIPDFTFNAAMERQKAAFGRTLDRSQGAPSPEELSAYVEGLRARGIQPNEHNIKADPEGQKLIQRARAADKASDEVQSTLRTLGLGDDKELQEAFGTIYGLTNPFGGFTPKRKVKRKTTSSTDDWASGSDWGGGSWGGSGSSWGGSKSTW